MGHRKMKVLLQIEAISLSKKMVHKYMNRELQSHSICYRKRPAYHRGLAHKIFSRQMAPCTIIVPLLSYTIEVLLSVKTALLSRVPWPCVRLKKCCQVQRLSTEPDFALESRKSFYFRRVCTTLSGDWDFSKHEPCGLSVWQCTGGTLLQHFKDLVDLSVSFWNCSRTGLCRFRICLRLVQSGKSTLV